MTAKYQYVSEPIDPAEVVGQIIVGNYANTKFAFIEGRPNDEINATLGLPNLSLRTVIKTLEGGPAFSNSNGTFEYVTYISLPMSNIKDIYSTSANFSAKITFQYFWSRYPIRFSGLDIESNAGIKSYLKPKFTGLFGPTYITCSFSLFNNNDSILTFEGEISLRGSIKFTINVFTVSAVKVDSLQTNSSLSLVDTQNIVNVFLSTDVFTGNNLAQCIMSSTGKKQISQYLPRIVKYVIGDGCNLSKKALDIAITYYKPNEALNTLVRLSLYSVLRYYLWYLIKGKFTLEILRSRYTTLFYTELAKSDYSNFVAFLNSDIFEGIDKFFIC